MNLQQLQYFTTVAKLQNISRAADLLHVSQSTLSKQISHLEEEFGTPFFDRNGRRITINRAGLRFLECSNKVLREVEFAREDIRTITEGNERRIRAGMAGTPEVFLSCMTEFAAQHPEAEFECCQGPAFLESADINEYDVMIYPDEMKYEKLKGYPLYEEQYYLAVCAAGDLARAAAFSLSLVEHVKMVFLRGKKGTPEYAFHVMNALAASLETVSFVDTREMHLQMIASGMAAGFVPREEAEIYQRCRNVRLLPVMDRRFSRPMLICFRREKHLAGLAKEFRDYLMEKLSLGDQEQAPGKR